MKTRTLIIVAAVLLLAPLLSNNLWAQEQLLFRVTIPFDFVAGGVHLSSGQYLAFHATPASIKLVREDGRASAWLAVKASAVMSGEGTNQMVFSRYGDAYFLSQVHTGYDQQVHECYKCRAEEALAAQYRSSKAKTVVVTAMR